MIEWNSNEAATQNIIEMGEFNSELRYGNWNWDEANLYQSGRSENAQMSGLTELWMCAIARIDSKSWSSVDSVNGPMMFWRNEIRRLLNLREVLMNIINGNSRLLS